MNNSAGAKVKTILVVDDNRNMTALICEILACSGLSVIRAHSVEEAFGIVEAPGALCALVTDINLGPGADGFDVARHARGAYPGLPVVYISAANARRHPIEGVKGSSFVAKPFTAAQMLGALDAAFRVEASANAA